jgi:hypothetical protein
VNANKTTTVVACRILEPEIEMLRQTADNLELLYLDQGLHCFPQKMPALIQDQINWAADHSGQIILGYGLCSNGIVGIVAKDKGLIVPRCHDCIAFFLGSCSAYHLAFKEHPGTFYLTSGWIKERKDPLSIIENEYIPRLGRKTAIWGMKEELKHYSHFVFINTGAGRPEHLRRRSLENAKFFKKQFNEVQGKLSYFKKLLYGPYLDEDFIFIKPGEQVKQSMFLSNCSKKTAHSDI